MSALGNSPNPPLGGAQADPRDPSAATKFALLVEQDPSFFGKIAMGLVLVMTFLRLPPFPYFVLLLMFCFHRMGAPSSGSYEILTQVCVQSAPLLPAFPARAAARAPTPTRRHTDTRPHPPAELALCAFLALSCVLHDALARTRWSAPRATPQHALGAPSLSSSTRCPHPATLCATHLFLIPLSVLPAVRAKGRECGQRSGLPDWRRRWRRIVRAPYPVLKCNRFCLVYGHASRLRY